ncbi:hypothetical protein VTO42DRAFT_4947 [Malbranchea cinnamomea]
MFRAKGSAGALRKNLLPLQQSYLGVSTYLRGIRVAPRFAPECVLRVRGRQCHAGRPLGQVADASPKALPPFLEEYKNTISFPAATANLADILQLDTTSEPSVNVYGYLSNPRAIGKKLIFADLIDPTLGLSIQLVAAKGAGAFERLDATTPNSAVVVRGTLKSKQAKKNAQEQEPPKDDQGRLSRLEIALEEVQCLNEFPKDIIMKPETVFPLEKRYLQLRVEKDLRDAIAFRARAARVLRAALEECSPPFMEVETPLLFKSTPEGAREFLVPTRKIGLAYALPQSPQQYKQILMASGIPRYYQFARCFRDEDLRADRQPEFTQLDLEMSFAKGEDVMSTIETVVKKLWSSLMPDPLPPGPFPRMTYQEAMSKYGSDKPDTRIGMEILNVGHHLPDDLISKISPLTNPVVEALVLRGNDDTRETSAFITEFMDSATGREFESNPDGGPGVFVYDVRKPLSGLGPLGWDAAPTMERLFDLQQGDLLILQARKDGPFSGGSTALGNLRRAIHQAAVKQGFKPAPTGFSFLWVTHFPLFSPSTDSEPGQGGSAGISSTHHPFTAPLGPEDVSALVTDPTKAIADHYDLVVNGVELGGGSRRIHSAAVQEFILRDVLKMPPSRLDDFSHLLEALRAGCPPHAGIALGFDRLVAVMLGRDSVRDVIAFPKTGKGEDVMVGAPSQMTESALSTYHLKLREEAGDDGQAQG